MSNYKSISAVLLLFVISIYGCVHSTEEVTFDELQNHISYLASDELAGRMTGTSEDSLSAEYIRKEFLS
ncbi:MAG: aminopeptidase, partial [Bacteroidales bacterium]|nr:aminopeptidase [Bacteroidales bacterium]